MRKAARMTRAMPVQQINVTPVEWGKEGRHGTPDNSERKDSLYATGANQAPTERCMSQASTLSNSYDICRICHCEGEGDAPLIAPCYCSGSLRYVHQACLQQWIKSSDIKACELCKFQFIMYSKIKPIMQWEHLELSALERRRLLCSVLFHTMALTCVLWSLYVLIDRTLEEINRGLLEWPLWTKLIVVTIGFSGGVAFMYIQGKTYCALCRRWRAFNRVIYVQNAPEKVALDAPSNPITIHQSIRADGAASLLGSGGCCGVQTESSVADIRDHPHEQNTSVDLHQGPATSTSYSNKSEGSTCKIEGGICTTHYRSPSMYDSKEDLGVSSKSGSLCNDDMSITSLDELTHRYCSNSGQNSIDADMEPLPPPAAFVDSATNTEIIIENEKAENKKFANRSSTSASGSPAHAEASVSGSRLPVSAEGHPDHENSSTIQNCDQMSKASDDESEGAFDQRVNSSFMLGSSLTYGRPTRIGYPYMLSTFHPMIPQQFSAQRREREHQSQSGIGSSSSSDECVVSLMKQPQSSKIENAGPHQSSRPWTVGGSYYLQPTSSDSWNQQPLEEIRIDRSGVHSAMSVPDTCTQPNCHSGSQSPLLSTPNVATIKSYPKTK